MGGGSKGEIIATVSECLVGQVVLVIEVRYRLAATESFAAHPHKIRLLPWRSVTADDESIERGEN